MSGNISSFEVDSTRQVHNCHSKTVNFVSSFIHIDVDYRVQKPTTLSLTIRLTVNVDSERQTGLICFLKFLFSEMDSCGKVVEICLVDRLELNFPHICNSLLVGDVDGDGIEEIMAGSRDGDLLVFKLTLSGRPYRKCSEPLGVISAMAIGDLFNSSRPTLTVICADGRLNAYQLTDNSFETFSSSFVQLLMPNIRAAFIQVCG